jgi:Trypsin-like peptidase domain
MRMQETPPFSPDILEALADLLRRCTARVAPTSDAKGGAGFFIDERHLLTCWHVVKREGPCSVWPEEREQRPGTVIAGDDKLDVALVQVEHVPGEPLRPTVAIRREFTDGPVLVSGYPRTDGKRCEHQNRDYTGQATTVQGRLTAIRLAGDNVIFGQSGGPVLDLATGAVVAMVCWTDAPGGVVGGRATSIAAVEEWFTAHGHQQVEEVLRTPPASVKDWRETIGDLQWTALGYRADADARELGPLLDIRVASVDGQRGSWQVFVDAPAGTASTLTVHDLGDDIADVLFHWGQRGRVHTEAEVSLFGRLLSSALFPQSVQQRLATVRTADTALIRLVMGNDALANVPWELAAAPGSDACFLAADEKLRLCRVASDVRSDGRGTEVRKPPAGARVVGIVVQKQDLHEVAPVVVNDREPRSWPDVERVVGRLEECLDLPAYQEVKVLKNPRPDQVEIELQGACDVVHYIGFGRWEKEQVQLAFADDEGRLDFHPAAKLFQWVCQANACLVVIELATPPPDLDLDPVPPGAFADALRASVGAVVFTSVPVHPLLYQPFNRSLYQVLAKGRTVEEAVQLSRKSLYTNQPLDDYAAFGWFALMTGPESGIRVVAPAAESPQQSAASRSLAQVGAGGAEPSEHPRSGRVDTFRRST